MTRPENLAPSHHWGHIMTTHLTPFLRFWRRLNELRRALGADELAMGAAHAAWRDAHARRFLREMNLRPAA